MALVSGDDLRASAGLFAAPSLEGAVLSRVAGGLRTTDLPSFSIYVVFHLMFHYWSNTP